jgi:hypothetical protein
VKLNILERYVPVVVVGRELVSGTMCTVRRELFDLFLQVVCRRGQWQAEEGVFSPANCSGIS